MNPEQLVALLSLLADLRLQISQLATENEALRQEMKRHSTAEGEADA